jgi:hypothetical protein
MALRILSGMIFVPHGGAALCNVEIGFNPFQLIASSLPGIELRKKQEIGPSGRFIRRPASMVAARQFAIMPMDSTWRVKLNDTVTRDSITISWRSKTSRVDQEEIPFMIIGEVPEAVPVPTLPPEVPPVIRRKRARSRTVRSKSKKE